MQSLISPLTCRLAIRTQSGLKRSVRKLAFAAGCVLLSAGAHAADCAIPAQLKAAQDNSVTKVFLTVFAGAPQKGVDCGSLASVWQKVTLRGKTGGRKLEGDKPLDVAAAQREWDGALRDAGIGARLKSLQKTIADPTELTLYQAAVLDEEGLYAARDWRLIELTNAINKAN